MFLKNVPKCEMPTISREWRGRFVAARRRHVAALAAIGLCCAVIQAPVLTAAAVCPPQLISGKVTKRLMAMSLRANAKLSHRLVRKMLKECLAKGTIALRPFSLRPLPPNPVGGAQIEPPFRRLLFGRAGGRV